MGLTDFLKTQPNGVGFSDKSADEDQLKVNRYIDGLADFIQTCVTPMTISIQGDWGSGKTSMMKLIDKKLGKNVIKIWFNT